MHFRDMFVQNDRTFSFEFFPPRSPALADELMAMMPDFAALRPTFVSVTYGAGGSTRERTHDMVIRLGQVEDVNPVPHLTCVCHDEPEIEAILSRYAAAGLSNIMALRGDMPTSSEPVRTAFRNATELVHAIQRFNQRGEHPHRQGFGIAVAGYPEGHPETANRLLEMDFLKAKVDAGADAIITQLFFDNHDFYDFRERCRLAGIRVPIIAGIMPITSIRGIRRIAELAAGSRYPAPLLRAIGRTDASEEAVRRVGSHWATEQCRDLLDHEVDGIHFYTLNRSTATRDIYLTLGVRDSRALSASGGR
ncbi:MAG: methylenetetrahydrofolate reductase [NAD(P)H] [Phycisphaeraceae bacterium]|nr:methylenetetrahydrofolate reductase [NAD(P)H] [Phycisphaeraceae bacterium]